MAKMRFAVTLDVDAPATRAALYEICDLISSDAGFSVEPLVAPSPGDLARALAEEAADFAWLSPTLLLMTPALRGAIPLLSCVRNGMPFFHSVIFTAMQSGITSLAELDGARAAWVAPTSAAGYLVPRLTLVQAGVSPSKALSHESFHDTHAAAARVVLAGKAEIGASYAHFEQGDASRRMIRAGYQEASAFARARVLAVSGAIPADMIASHAKVDRAARSAFAAALCRLVHDPVGSESFATVIGAEDFRPVAQESLEELERLMEATSRVSSWP